MTASIGILKWDNKKQINEELLDNFLSEIIIKLVSDTKFSSMMQDKIRYDGAYGAKSKLIEETDSLDPMTVT